MNRFKFLALTVVYVLVSPAAIQADDGAKLNHHLQRGEFSAAKSQANRLEGQAKDDALAQVAVAQIRTGDHPSAAQTLAQIDSPSARGQVLEGRDNPPQGGAGGGSLADFTSLIDLIQSTIDPETWDALGGPSTIREYPQGVFVDPDGILKRCETLPKSDSSKNLSGLLRAVGRQADGPDGHSNDALGVDDWKNAAKMRCVSLRRMRDAWTQLSLIGGTDAQALSHMAGLSSIQYVIFHEDDIVVAGPTHGIENHQGWFRDQQTGQAAIRFDILATTLGAARHNQAFGCTIDPKPQRLQRAATVAANVQSKNIPIGKAADALVEAIGFQNIEVFGTASDTPIALLMVEADRHMKELALGVHPMPERVPNYLDAVTTHLKQGLPNDLLLRLWFTANPRGLRCDQGQNVFELNGTPIRLSGENERAMADGARGNLTRDIRSEFFVEHFNENWSQIRAQYPVYAGLESVYQAASLAAVASEHAQNSSQEMLIDSIAAMASTLSSGGRVPREVETIAVLHRIREGKKRHHVVVASGGVSVSPKMTLSHTVQPYAPLSSMTSASEQRSQLVDRWWWDAN